MPEYQFITTHADEPEFNQDKMISYPTLIEIFPFLKSAPNFDEFTMIIGLTKYHIKRG